MRRVISLALFGDRGYGNYLGAVVRANLNLFPPSKGWQMVVHIDDITDGSRLGTVLRRLENDQLLVVRRMGPAVLTKAMLWRMAPVFEEGAEYVYCRDIDALPMPRDVLCCAQFEVSRAAVHTIHDHVAHTGIMGGLSSFCAPLFCKANGVHSLEALYQFAGSQATWARHGTDQDVLNRLVNRPGGPVLLEHRYAGWVDGKPKQLPVREPSMYFNPAYSVPTPDGAGHPADALAPHLGSAGFNHVLATAYWNEHGDPVVTARVAACEDVS